MVIQHCRGAAVRALRPEPARLLLQRRIHIEDRAIPRAIRSRRGLPEGFSVMQGSRGSRAKARQHQHQEQGKSGRAGFWFYRNAIHESSYMRSSLVRVGQLYSFLIPV